ncbi:MAG: M28 family peptidase [Chloroflexi bacterium]|nr:M28 family peptidase [Chloroflexota bacterium]
MAYTLRSGDFAAFLRRGLPATSLQTSGSPEAELAYHAVHDRLDVIQPHALDMTARAALEMIRRI